MSPTIFRFLALGAVIASVLFGLAPAQPASAQDVAAIAAGYRHNCVLTTDSGIKCWGDNVVGQVGDGTTIERHAPTDVQGLSGPVTAVDAGDAHTCALTADGHVQCWGRNEHGQLGRGTTNDLFTANPTPVDVCADEACEGPLLDIVFITTGDSHTCALTSTGQAKCWGLNDHGQNGDAATTSRSAPVDVVNPEGGFVSLEAGAFHTCGLTESGGVMCWGKNGEGQLGDDRACYPDCTTPIGVVGLDSGVASVVAAGLHTCALKTDGGMMCWGFNFDGQLGHDSPDHISIVPVQVAGLESGVAAIAANGIFRGHTCALMTSGGVKCWGDNAYGQVGDNSVTDRRAPVDVVGLASGIAALSAGNGHTCALTIADRVKCWGDNTYGKLGDGTTQQRNTPVDTLGLKAVTSGDASCDTIVNSIDGALVLQFVAGLLGSLPCWENADANLDGEVNSIDAQLILQFSAGLLPSLPP